MQSVGSQKRLGSIVAPTRLQIMHDVLILALALEAPQLVAASSQHGSDVGLYKYS